MQKVIIHWKIGNAEGHGSPIELKEAISWVNTMNKKYGEGTHWYESA